MRLATLLLIAGCNHTALPPPERAMLDQSLGDRPGPGLLVDDYICDKACEDRISNGITLISP
jgi:hypothetical protein